MLYKSVKAAWLHPPNYLLIILLARELTQCEGCQDGWFGKECNMLCHCSKSKTCALNGDCPVGEGCADGLFGPACQYADLAFYNVKTQDYFSDNNVKTCTTHTQSRSVQLEFKYEFVISWFRVITNRRSNLLNFTTTVNTERDYHKEMACINEKKFLVNDRTVDVTCDNTRKCTNVWIKGPIVGDLCDIHMSEGRNIALKEKTAMNTYSCPRCGSEKAVDGNTGQKECAISGVEYFQAEWRINFPRPYILYALRVFPLGNISTKFAPHYLRAFSSKRVLPGFVRGVLEAISYKYQYLEGKYDPPVTKLTIRQGIHNVGDYHYQIRICEVIVLGDTVCPKNTYGFNCTKCRCNFAENCMPYTGGCGLVCPPGFYGNNCTSGCRENCKGGICGLNNGTCVSCKPGYTGDRCEETCLPGLYGDNCSSLCPEFCEDDICNISSGHCFKCLGNREKPLCQECSDGFYGENCTTRCSVFCDNRKCDSQSGYCFSCVGHRIGDDCGECESLFYGTFCDRQCPSYCLNGTCESKTGMCSKCKKGYKGDLCIYVIDKPLAYVAAFSFLPFTLLTIFLLPTCADDEYSEYSDE